MIVVEISGIYVPVLTFSQGHILMYVREFLYVAYSALETYKRYHGNIPNISSIIYVCSRVFFKIARGRRCAVSRVPGDFEKGPL
jgi:hypothetical protein